MRGKGIQTDGIEKISGITPAYAGKSYDSIRKGFFQKDHPRLCGEKRAVYSPSSNGVGSPPPMRGKVRGKGPVCHRTQDHPRLCGEKSLTSLFENVLRGSPPPMRGKEIIVFVDTVYQRDHPRLCGEKSGSVKRASSLMGSPPPMRGKASADSPLAYRSRITPAYAGKRKRKPNGMLQSKDHPRLCGEKVTAGSSWFRLAGSPPPMRGKEGGKLCAIIMPRITPAYAGKRRISVGYLRFCGDPPRLCGEKSTPSASDSSPVRITPAYAGKRFRLPDKIFLF